MAGLTNVSAPTGTARDMVTRLDTEEILNSGVSRENVAGEVAAIIASTKATKNYVDSQDSGYAPVAYYSTQDALLVPNTAKGAPNGVASLTSASKVTQAQMPTLGAGILEGPYGANQSFAATTSTTPSKIAQWNLGTGHAGQPWIWLSTSVQSSGRPIIEVRIGTSAQTTYASQTLIGQGFGRSWYNDYQIITVIPVTALDGEGQDGIQDTYSPATNLLVNAWLYDASGTAVTSGTSIASAALYFARTAL